MKKAVLFSIGLLALLASCSKVDKDPKVVVITFDGLRWQEVFTGADSTLLADPRFTRDSDALKAEYWRETPEERRQVLMPYTWSHIASNGYLLGNRGKNSLMQVSNNKSYSYPGYSEMFCGWADDERVDSNDPVPNPNVSVMEVVNQDPRYKGRVMVYGSWESIRYAVNNDRGGFPGSTAYESNVSPNPSPALKSLDLLQESIWGKGGDERPDGMTYAYAIETIRNDHPKLLFVSFGETDESGHAGDYDRYLHIVTYTDSFIRDIIETCESDPFYKGKTTYLLTTDHGRGRGEKFVSHGADVRGANETWVMALGRGIPALGETSQNGPFYTKQMAATIADLLGVDFTPGNGVKCEPFDPTYYKAPETPVAEAVFEAIKATPKGHGIRYTYHEGPFMSVEEALASPVKASGTIPFFSTDAKLTEDHFGFNFNTLMKIEKAGLYQLSLASDDGSKLILDGKLLFDLNRDGGGYAEAWINLEAGFHRLEIPYFENYGGENLEVGLIGQGIEVEQLPASMLWYD